MSITISNKELPRFVKDLMETAAITLAIIGMGAVVGAILTIFVRLGGAA